MATYTSYDQVGIKEDVSNIISNIDPTDTPFQSSLGTYTVSNRVFEWQEDSLDAPGSNAQVEGADATDGALTPTVMRTNNVQIFAKTIKVSETADAVSTYGRAKETGYQMAKKGAELKRDREYAFVGINQAAVTGSSTVARQTASALAQVSAATTLTVDSDSGTAGNQAGPLLETYVTAVHQDLFTAGANPKIFMIKPADSLIVAGFANSAGRQRIVNGEGSKTVVNAVNLYVSPFGELKVVLNRFLKADSAVLYDPAQWKVAVLRNWARTLLAKTGDNKKFQMVGEFGLRHMNQKASGVITNLT